MSTTAIDQSVLLGATVYFENIQGDLFEGRIAEITFSEQVGEYVYLVQTRKSAIHMMWNDFDVFQVRLTCTQAASLLRELVGVNAYWHLYRHGCEDFETLQLAEYTSLSYRHGMWQLRDTSGVKQNNQVISLLERYACEMGISSDPIVVFESTTHG